MHIICCICKLLYVCTYGLKGIHTCNVIHTHNYTQHTTQHYTLCVYHLCCLCVSGVSVCVICTLLTLHLVTCVLRYSLVGVSCHSSSHNMMYSSLYIVRNQMNWKMMGKRECCQ